MPRPVVQVRCRDGSGPVLLLVRVRGPVDYPAGDWLPRMRRRAVWAAVVVDGGHVVGWRPKVDGPGERSLEGWRREYGGPAFVWGRVTSTWRPFPAAAAGGPRGW